MDVRELLLGSSRARVFDEGLKVMNQPDDIVERIHNKDEAEDANQHPPNLASSPQSIFSSRLWYPKQALGAETACHWDEEDNLLPRLPSGTRRNVPRYIP
jgi:hypothetical protein